MLFALAGRRLTGNARRKEDETTLEEETNLGAWSNSHRFPFRWRSPDLRRAFTVWDHLPYRSIFCIRKRVRFQRAVHGRTRLRVQRETEPGARTDPGRTGWPIVSDRQTSNLL